MYHNLCKRGENMLRIAICDDDKITVESHRNITENCLKDCGSIGEIETYITSDNLLCDITEDGFFFDLILLDIEMPGSTGMDIAEKIKPYLPNVKIIFITSHIEYAIDAFELSVFRYVPKTNQITLFLQLFQYLCFKNLDNVLSFFDFICFAHIFSIISVSRQTLCTLPE